AGQLPDSLHFFHLSNSGLRGRQRRSLVAQTLIGLFERDGALAYAGFQFLVQAFPLIFSFGEITKCQMHGADQEQHKDDRKGVKRITHPSRRNRDSNRHEGIADDEKVAGGETAENGRHCAGSPSADKAGYKDGGEEHEEGKTYKLASQDKS